MDTFYAVYTAVAPTIFVSYEPETFSAKHDEPYSVLENLVGKCLTMLTVIVPLLHFRGRSCKSFNDFTATILLFPLQLDHWVFCIRNEYIAFIA